MRIDYARMAGIHNINVDLIYNLPGPSVDRRVFAHCTAMCWMLGVEHLSCYALTLTIEGNVPIYEDAYETAHLPKPRTTMWRRICLKKPERSLVRALWAAKV